MRKIPGGAAILSRPLRCVRTATAVVLGGVLLAGGGPAAAQDKGKSTAAQLSGERLAPMQ